MLVLQGISAGDAVASAHVLIDVSCTTTLPGAADADPRFVLSNCGCHHEFFLLLFVYGGRKTCGLAQGHTFFDIHIFSYWSGHNAWQLVIGGCVLWSHQSLLCFHASVQF